MQPTMRAGSLLIVNHTVDRLSGDGIYAIQLDGDLYVKRVQRMLGGGFVISSDNKEYRDQEVRNPEAVGLIVIGAVVWHGDFI